MPSTPPPSDAAQSNGHATPDDSGRRVLVVEDDLPLARLMEALLQSAGYRVRTAGDGESGLNAVHAEQPALVLLDLTIPKLDGWEVLSRLRAAAGQQTPVVVMTAGYNAQERALASGAQGYLGKPFELEDLYTAVEAHAGLPMDGSHETARH